MSPAGGNDLLIEARAALLDALAALDAQRDAVIVIGAQAVYLHTGAAQVALAEATKDSDLALDPRRLLDEPLLESAMRFAGFIPHLSGQPGAWMSPRGIPVDLMVPEELAGAGSRGARGARIPPHSRHASRRAVGLEAAIVDNSHIDIDALDPGDFRVYTARVAGPAALLVAKLHKIGERTGAPDRLVDKDAHDIYRILVAVPTAQLASTLRTLGADPISREATDRALEYFDRLFATGPHAIGSTMAGRAEEGIGDPEQVALAVSLLASDALDAVRDDTSVERRRSRAESRRP